MALGVSLLLAILHLGLVLAAARGDLIPRVVSTRSLMELAVPVSEKIQNERCKNHSELYVRDLKKLKLWAAESKFQFLFLLESTV